MSSAFFRKKRRRTPAFVFSLARRGFLRLRASGVSRRVREPSPEPASRKDPRHTRRSRRPASVLAGPQPVARPRPSGPDAGPQPARDAQALRRTRSRARPRTPSPPPDALLCWITTGTRWAAFLDTHFSASRGQARRVTGHLAVLLNKSQRQSAPENAPKHHERQKPRAQQRHGKRAGGTPALLSQASCPPPFLTFTMPLERAILLWAG